jgi:DNA-directed RNA polymerase I, II, and III subunit RPABC5
MIIPIRCFTCNKIIGNKWEPYQKFLSDGKTAGEALTILRLKRMCCRRMLLTHVDMIDDLLIYREAEDKRISEEKAKYIVNE